MAKKPTPKKPVKTQGDPNPPPTKPPIAP